MATIFDVSKYILETMGPMSSMKLQKLAYYCQGYQLAWTDKSLFREDFEAWRMGPVSPMLYSAHRGNFSVSSADIEGNSSNLTEYERETIDIVLVGYGDFTAQELSTLTHSESPWKDARGSLEPIDNSQTVINKFAMKSFFEKKLEETTEE